MQGRLRTRGCRTTFSRAEHRGDQAIAPTSFLRFRCGDGNRLTYRLLRDVIPNGFGHEESAVRVRIREGTGSSRAELACVLRSELVRRRDCSLRRARL